MLISPIPKASGGGAGGGGGVGGGGGGEGAAAVKVMLATAASTTAVVPLTVMPSRALKAAAVLPAKFMVYCLTTAKPATAVAGIAASTMSSPLLLEACSRRPAGALKRALTVQAQFVARVQPSLLQILASVVALLATYCALLTVILNETFLAAATTFVWPGGIGGGGRNGESGCEGGGGEGASGGGGEGGGGEGGGGSGAWSGG